MNKLLTTLLMVLILQPSIAQTKKITGFYEMNIEKELSLESEFDKKLKQRQHWVKQLKGFPLNHTTSVLRQIKKMLNIFRACCQMGMGCKN